LDEIEDVLHRLSNDVNSYSGEIKAMQDVLDSTTGKKPPSDLENTIYEVYHKRLCEIRLTIKQAKKKKKNNKTRRLIWRITFMKFIIKDTVRSV